MHEIAETVPPSDIMATPAGIAAKAFVLNQAARFMAARGSYRCKACGKRCEVAVEYEGAHIIHSTGRCGTRDCIAWEE